MKYLKAIGISVLAIVMLIVAQALESVAELCLYKIGCPLFIASALCGILYIAIALAEAKLVMEKLLHIKLSDNGITGFKLEIRWVAIAFLLPVIVAACYLLIFPGEFVTSGVSNEMALEIVASGIFYTGLGAGFVEEMVFRGFIFGALERAWNTKVAVIVPSVLFGLVHILGMDFSFGSCLLVIVAGTAVGIMFSLIRIESGSIWCSAFAHAVWNIIIIGGLLSISDAPDEFAVTTYVLGMKSFAVTGGEFGIESSVISLAGYVIVSLVAVFMMRRKAAGNGADEKG